MNLTRRVFLSASAAVVAVMSLETLSPALAATRLGLRRATFTPLVGRTLQLSRAGRPTMVRLAHVRDIAGAAPGSDASFALQFTSPEHLADGIYLIDDRRTGRHHIFVAGVGARPHRSYEAVVNHTHAPARAVHQPAL